MFDLTEDEILSLSKEHVFYTWSAQAKVNPIAVKRAKGVYFWDLEDKRYLDFNSMTMCVNIGHGDERVIRAMQEQAAELEKGPEDPNNADEKDLRERTRYIASVSGLTMLKYGVSLVNEQLGRYLSSQKTTSQPLLDQFNKRLASLAATLEQSVAGVTQYRTKYLTRLSL